MYYKYKVSYYSSYNDEEIEDTGLVWASDYGDAANAVVKDYGHDEVIEIFLHEMVLDADEIRSLSLEDINYAFDQHK